MPHGLSQFVRVISARKTSRTAVKLVHSCSACRIKTNTQPQASNLPFLSSPSALPKEGLQKVRRTHRHRKVKEPSGSSGSQWWMAQAAFSITCNCCHLSLSSCPYSTARNFCTLTAQCQVDHPVTHPRLVQLSLSQSGGASRLALNSLPSGQIRILPRKLRDLRCSHGKSEKAKAVKIRSGPMPLRSSSAIESLRARDGKPMAKGGLPVPRMADQTLLRALTPRPNQGFCLWTPTQRSNEQWTKAIALVK